MVEQRLSQRYQQVLTIPKFRRLEKIQKNSQEVETYLFWQQNRQNHQQEVRPMGTYELGQEM